MEFMDKVVVVADEEVAEDEVAGEVDTGSIVVLVATVVDDCVLFC